MTSEPATVNVMELDPTMGTGGSTISAVETNVIELEPLIAPIPAIVPVGAKAIELVPVTAPLPVIVALGVNVIDDEPVSPTDAEETLPVRENVRLDAPEIAPWPVTAPEGVNVTLEVAVICPTPLTEAVGVNVSVDDAVTCPRPIIEAVGVNVKLALPVMLFPAATGSTNSAHTRSATRPSSKNTPEASSPNIPMPPFMSAMT